MISIFLDQDGTLYRKDQPLTDDPLKCLGAAVTLAPACTLRSFFRMLIQYKSLQQLNDFIPDYIAEYRRSPEKECLFPGVQWLGLNRTVEMTGYPGTPTIRIFVSLDGHDALGRCPIKTAGIEHLLDIPLRLGRLTHSVFGDQVDTLKFDTVFNLFELIDGICWQLSFHNWPESCKIKP